MSTSLTSGALNFGRSLRRHQRAEAWRAAAIVAVTGGGIGALAAAGYGILVAEARLARHVIGKPFGDEAPRADGLYAPEATAGEPLHVVILGDSGAAGLGCDEPEETPGAVLARGMAAHTGRPVRLTTLAVVGAESSELAEQLERLDRLRETYPPDVAVVIIGGNDITNQVRIPAAVADLARCVAQLRAWNCEVVVGTCPDLGTIRPVPQPLRVLARRLSRHLASAQTVAAVSAGARTVSLGDLLGPTFDADPAAMFSRDRFHPSAEGYARITAAVLPSVCAAAGYPMPDDENQPPAESAAPVAVVAARAVESAGTEVSPAEPAGSPLGIASSAPETGPAAEHDDRPASQDRPGRWARLRRRRSDTCQDDVLRTPLEAVGKAG